jgi:hypothetical protein
MDGYGRAELVSDEQSGRSSVRRKPRASVKDAPSAASIGLADELADWPQEAPPEPRTVGERARLELIRSPGAIRALDFASTDRARANRVALAYTRSLPAKLDPAASGTFDARVWWDSHVNQYRVAVRYTPTRSDEG